jgi:hypothetical protein
LGFQPMTVPPFFHFSKRICLICNISHQDISRLKGFVWLRTQAIQHYGQRLSIAIFLNMANQTTRTTPTKTTKPLFDWWFLSQHLK